jgi:hypothetical protein
VARRGAVVLHRDRPEGHSLIMRSDESKINLASILPATGPAPILSDIREASLVELLSGSWCGTWTRAGQTDGGARLEPGLRNTAPALDPTGGGQSRNLLRQGAGFLPYTNWCGRCRRKRRCEGRDGRSARSKRGGAGLECQTGVGEVEALKLGKPLFAWSVCWSGMFSTTSLQTPEQGDAMNFSIQAPP